jgi:hypothetical protein
MQNVSTMQVHQAQQDLGAEATNLLPREHCLLRPDQRVEVAVHELKGQVEIASTGLQGQNLV